MERDVIVREAGLRDGLQIIQDFFPTESKKAWLTAEAAAGVPEIEATSFVPPKYIPQFADAAEVVEHALTLPNVQITVLIPNLKGAERGFTSGAHRVAHFLSASESFNQANLKRPIADSLKDLEDIVALRATNPEWAKTRLACYISTAFGCSIEGKVDPDTVIRLVGEVVACGAEEIYLGDTVGYGNPAQVRELFRRAKAEAGDVVLGGHFHDTRGLGLANVAAALEEGITVFDASMAGLGGCPHAPGATGNIVTEDLVYMLESMGLRTGIDLDALIRIRELIARELPHEPLHGSIAIAKLPKGFTAAT